jgi:hypothetical protein
MCSSRDQARPDAGRHFSPSISTSTTVLGPGRNRWLVIAGACLALLIPAASGLAASPPDGGEVERGAVQFDVPPGTYWSGTWRSRLLVVRGSASDLASAWGAWAYLDYGALRDQVNRIGWEYSARGMYYSSMRESAQADARRNFYSAGWSSDIAGASLFGPRIFKVVAYDPTVSVTLEAPGTYHWQTRYISSWDQGDNGRQEQTQVKSFTVKAPPAPAPSQPAQSAGSGAAGRQPAPGATSGTAPSCAAEESAFAVADRALTLAKRRLSRAKSPALKKRLRSQRAAAQTRASSAAAALRGCRART